MNKLLDLVAGHTAEITELFRRGDPHAVVETGDLLVLCLEAIIESGESPDRVVAECFGRYERKLKLLLKEGSDGTSARKGKGISQGRFRA